MWPWKRLIEVKPTAFCNRLYLLVIRPAINVPWRDLTYNFIFTSRDRRQPFIRHCCSFLFLFSFKHRTSWLVIFTAILIESLRGHVEVLDFEMLDAIAKNSVLLPQMDQLRINVINRYPIVRSHLFFTVLFKITELAVLSIGVDDLAFDFACQQRVQLVTIVSQYAFNKL